MYYTIKETSEKTGFSAYTLRFYDKSGLMPKLKRSENGNRLYSENDILWLGLIDCLKNSGMQLKDIKHFMELCLDGNDTAIERKDMLINHKEAIIKKIAELECSLNTINYKIDHYKEVGIFHIDN